MKNLEVNDEGSIYYRGFEILVLSSGGSPCYYIENSISSYRSIFIACEKIDILIEENSKNK